ncbi:putative perilipin-2 [Scophthalmus maximus]|uniref:Putative perilipin-2 n=1 Tax=Scophthalmus maximus TaxID=52904 RepID=A0A2U9CWE3_SCOMX|nr:putative perilipin-2 [Scophthalmus maximus]
MAAADVISHQNVVQRVTSLPLVSSTYGLVSSMYCTTKDTHQYIRSVCEELEAQTVKGFDKRNLSYYVQLGSLSTKLRKRAYNRAVAKIQDGKQCSRVFISVLNATVDVIEYGRNNIAGANQIVIEFHILALAHSLTQELQTTCLVLVCGLQGLPNHIQQEALSLGRSASHVYTVFSKVRVLGDLPDSMLASSKAQLGKMIGSLDNVMDYLVNNTPLNWLLGPFYPFLSGISDKYELLEIVLKKKNGLKLDALIVFIKCLCETNFGLVIRL